MHSFRVQWCRAKTISRAKPPCFDFSSCNFTLKRHIWAPLGKTRKGRRKVLWRVWPLGFFFLVFGEVIGSLIEEEDSSLSLFFLWWEETSHASLYDLGYVFDLLQRATLWVTAGDPVVQSTLLLGPLYTKSQGQCSTHIKHSYWWKSWNQPQGLYTRSQSWTRNNLFNLPKVTNKCWTLWPCIGPKAGKRIPSNLGGWFCNPWGQCFNIY